METHPLLHHLHSSPVTMLVLSKVMDSKVMDNKVIIVHHNNLQLLQLLTTLDTHKNTHKWHLDNLTTVMEVDHMVGTNSVTWILFSILSFFRTFSICTLV